jgi:hypothetical protein
MRFFTGAQPAATTDADSGTLLVELSLPADWAAAAAAGQKDKQGTWNGTVIAAGTVGHYRVYDTAGTTCHEQGSVGNSGADLNGANTALTVNQVIVINSKTLHAGNA